MTTRLGSHRGGLALVAILSAALGTLAGCEVDSFLDPSKTGRFEHMPTTIPILEQLDVIEQNRDPWGQTSSVTADDLIPTDLSYRMAPGDMLTVQIFELYTQGVWHVSTRRIDAGGFFRLPEIGDVQAAGMTAQQFEDRVTELLHTHVIQDPLVDVVIEEGGGFTYTIYGAISSTGLFRLQRPDLRLLDALAAAGGVPLSIETIYVIRGVELTDEMQPDFMRQPDDATPEPVQPRSIDELIEDLPGGDDDGVRPGILPQDEPVVDVDDLATPVGQDPPPTVDVDETRQSAEARPREQDTFIYDEQRGEWVRIRGAGSPPPVDDPLRPGGPPMVLERVIEIPFQELKRGDSSYNIIVRPNDRIYVEEPPTGVVYIDGEISRPGVYNLPFNSRLTLSRLVAAAGGLGAIAIPQRVDLTRVVGESREATVRLDLKAIRNRTEPDIYLKADDHVIIGTNFWATPLAIVRSGFRATYGFGFLLDRNFGNDVFGAPPVNVR